MDLPLERTANPWKVWWAEQRILPFEDMSKKPLWRARCVATKW